MNKERDVRCIAAEQGFANAKKAESEDICFIPDGDYAGYIERRCGHRSGSRATSYGATVPWSDVTTVRCATRIGQRKGLGVAMAHPVYVTGVDADKQYRALWARLEDLTAGSAARPTIGSGAHRKTAWKAELSRPAVFA